MTSPDVVTTETAGLSEVARPSVIRLHDGDHLDLDISPVRKELDGAGLRMLAYTASIPGPCWPSAHPRTRLPRLQRLEDQGAEVVLVAADLRLPGMEGVELLERRTRCTRVPGACC